MTKNKSILVGGFLTLLALAILFHCQLPSDPKDPSNTSASILLETSYFTQGTESITDTIGNTIRVGVVLKVPEYIDSIIIAVTSDGDTAFYATFTDFSTNMSDTVWNPISFEHTGTWIVTLKPYSSQIKLSPEMATITIVAPPAPNNKPSITVNENNFRKPAETCSLVISLSDIDTLQTLSVAMQGNPEGSTLSDDTLFIWTIPETFIGEDTITFIVTDNGTPPLSDTAIAVISVSENHVNHAPEWSSETLHVTKNDSTPYTLELSPLCSDPDGDDISFTLLSDSPEDEIHINESNILEFTPADTGLYSFRIMASDSGNATDIMTLEMSVHWEIAVDTTPPSIALFAPSQDSQTLSSSSYQVTVSCRDKSGIATVQCISGEDTLSMSRNSDTLFSATVENLLPSEWNLINIIATDSAPLANSRIMTMSIKYDPTVPDNVPPVITLLSPSTDTVVYNGALTVHARCRDDSGIASVKIIHENDTTSAVREDDGDIYSGTIDNLSGGHENTITILATDASSTGNQKTVSLVVFYENDTDGPTITFFAPSADTTIKSDSCAVTVQVTDGSDVAQVYFLINGDTIRTEKSDNDLYTGTVRNLPANQNTEIIITAVDHSYAQNNTSKTLQIRRVQIPVYSLTISTENGDVDISPDAAAFDSGTVVRLTPVPTSGYHFTGWSGDLSGSDDPADIVMTDNKSITANFEVNAPNSYTLSILATNGSVDKTPDLPQYTSGSTVELKAKSATGYHFVNWTGDATGSADSTSVTMTASKNITANFALNTYALTVNSDEHGTTNISGDIVVNHDASTQIIATPSNGYKFDKWVSTTGTSAIASTLSATTTVKLSAGDATITATFTPITYTLTVGSNGNGTTTPSGSSTVAEGVPTSISATPASGFRFVNWTSTGTVSFDDPSSATALVTLTSGNATVKANFTAITYTLVVGSNGNGTTTPSGSSTVAEGVPTLISATPASGYQFANWTFTGTVTFDDQYLASTQVTLTSGNATVKANFTAMTYTLTVNNDGNGTTTPSGNTPATYGAATSITATPATGYQFDKWIITAGSPTISNASSSATTVTLNSGDAAVKATFAKLSYTLTLSNDGHGATTPSGAISVEHGTRTSISASPAYGYNFDSWVASSGTVTFGSATSAITTATLTSGNATITAHFTPITFNLTMNNGGNGTTTPSGVTTVNQGVATTIQATPAPGYQFSGWAITSGTATIANTGLATTTATLSSGDATITAQWTQLHYTVTYHGNGYTSGSVPSDAATYIYNQKVIILANPEQLIKSSLSFAGWNTSSTGNGTNYHCGQEISMGTSNIDLYANFSSDSVMDNDGNIYHTVIIGSQTWLVENLKTTKYSDGTSISVVEPSNLYSQTSPACTFADKDTYGGLYNSLALNGSPGDGSLPPAGWLIPSSDDFQQLIDYLDSKGTPSDQSWYAVNSLRSTTWTSTSGASNKSGFSAQPEGICNNSGITDIGTFAHFWTRTEYVANIMQYGYQLGGTDGSSPSISRNTYPTLYVGLSVRCIKK